MIHSLLCITRGKGKI